jgi:TolB-like protein
MKRVIGENEQMMLVLRDEQGKHEPVELIVRRVPSGLLIEFTDDEDHRGVLVDYFDGKLSAKIWADRYDEDFTNSVQLS